MQTFRALIAKGMNGTGIILATDGDTLAFDIEAISDSVDEVGLCELGGEPGLYLWTGTAKTVNGGSWDGPPEPETEYAGSVRRVRSDETALAEFLAMEPPHVYCHECSAAGAAGAPVYHLPPACGREE